MSETKFKTLRHIETVRNYLNLCVVELLKRSEQHDQTKLEDPEVEYFEKYTPKFKTTSYGSDEYYDIIKQMKPAIDHHNQNNRHHPEFHENDLSKMNLIDLIEMICDWFASTLRSPDSNILRSIEIGQKRFGYSDELKNILINTADLLCESNVFHKANES